MKLFQKELNRISKNMGQMGNLATILPKINPKIQPKDFFCNIIARSGTIVQQNCLFSQKIPFWANGQFEPKFAQNYATLYLMIHMKDLFKTL